MQYLSGRGPRHLVVADERNRPRSLVACDAGPTPLQQLLPRDSAVVVHDHHRVYRLSPFLVRDADDGHVLDGGMLAEKRFDFRRIDVLSAADDHVALAVDE